MAWLESVPPQQLEPVRNGLERLTPREMEVLRLAIQGETTVASSEAMGISVRTVELHRQQVLSKLGVRSMTQAVRMIALMERSDRR